MDAYTIVIIVKACFFVKDTSDRWSPTEMWQIQPWTWTRSECTPDECFCCFCRYVLSLGRIVYLCRSGIAFVNIVLLWYSVPRRLAASWVTLCIRVRRVTSVASRKCSYRVLHLVQVYGQGQAQWVWSSEWVGLPVLTHWDVKWVSNYSNTSWIYLLIPGNMSIVSSSFAERSRGSPTGLVSHSATKQVSEKCRRKCQERDW